MQAIHVYQTFESLLTMFDYPYYMSVVDVFGQNHIIDDPAYMSTLVGITSAVIWNLIRDVPDSMFVCALRKNYDDACASWAGEKHVRHPKHVFEFVSCVSSLLGVLETRAGYCGGLRSRKHARLTCKSWPLDVVVGLRRK
eukprot:4555956-Karenia_brevis.AAC.1